MRHFPRCTWKDYVSPMKRVMLACFHGSRRSSTLPIDNLFYVSFFFLFQHTNGSHRFSKCIFCFVCAAVISYQKQLGKEKCFLQLTGCIQVRRGEAKHLEVGPETETMEESSLPAWSPWLTHVYPRFTLLGTAPTTLCSVPVYRLEIKKLSHRHANKASPMKATPQWSVPLSSCGLCHDDN